MLTHIKSSRTIFSILTLCLGYATNSRATVTDISTLDNVIYVLPTTVQAGTQVQLSLQMKNTALIRGFQLDLTLPKGVTVDTYANGKIKCSLTAARRPEGDAHTLDAATQSDGSIRLLCGSTADETFTGTEGEIATLTVNIASGMADGDYPIVISYQKLTETNIKNFYEVSNVESKLTIGEVHTILGDVNHDDSITMTDVVKILSYILGDSPEDFDKTVADLNGDGYVNITDVVMLIVTYSLKP